MVVDLFGVAAVIGAIMSPVVVIYTAKLTRRDLAAVKVDVGGVKKDVSDTHHLVNSKADEQARQIKELEAEVRRLQTVGTSTPSAVDSDANVTYTAGSVQVRPKEPTGDQ